VRRRDFLLFPVIYFAPTQTFAQPLVAKHWRIGLIDTTPEELNQENLASFREGLDSIGLREGRNLTLEYRSARTEPEIPDLVRDFMAEAVDLLVVRGTPEIVAVKNATNSIPVVMVAVVDPVHAGVIESLQRPGGNITGMASAVTALEQKRVQLLKELLPQLNSLAVVGDFRNPAVQEQWDQVRAAAAATGINTIGKFPVQRSEDLEEVFGAIAGKHIQAARVGVDGVTRPNRKIIIELCRRYVLPTVFAAREFAVDGGLMAFGANYRYLYRHAASFIGKIVSGENPGAIPVEEPAAFELTVNLRTANSLGLSFPPTLLARADEVIE